MFSYCTDDGMYVCMCVCVCFLSFLLLDVFFLNGTCAVSGDECRVAVATGGKSGSSEMQVKTIDLCVCVCVCVCVTG